MNRFRLIPIAACSGLIGGLVACATEQESFETHRVRYQEDAGAIHFAVLSVARWEDYAEAMQPRFELDEQAALSQVVPTTQALQQSLLRLAQGTVGAERRTDSAEGGEGGDVGSEVFLSGANPTDHHQPSVLNSDVQVDPMLRYWAATALFQEVQLLNRFVQDAALRKGYEPYVVRLQLSVMPSARHEPYDAYSSLSFFSKSSGSLGDAGGDLVASADAGATVPTRGNGEGDVWNTPQVVPLMVTDNMEASLRSRMVDDVRQLAASLSYFGQSGVAGSNFQQVDRELTSVFGRDINSLLTVGRVSDNTLRVRLGAQSEATADFAMVPRTHNITVLLLVPGNAPEGVQVLSKSTMVDAISGEELASRNNLEVDRALEGIALRYGLERGAGAALKSLLPFVQANDQPGYFSALERVLPESGEAFPFARALWVDLVGHMSGSQYASTEFDVPRPQLDDSDLLPPLQLLQLLDEGDGRARIVLKRASDPGRASIDATLYVLTGGRRLPILAESIRFDSSLQELDVFLASPAGFGLAESGLNLGELSLELRHDKGSRRYDVLATTP